MHCRPAFNTQATVRPERMLLKNGDIWQRFLAVRVVRKHDGPSPGETNQSDFHIWEAKQPFGLRVGEMREDAAKGF